MSFASRSVGDCRGRGPTINRDKITTNPKELIQADGNPGRLTTPEDVPQLANRAKCVKTREWAHADIEYGTRPNIPLCSEILMKPLLVVAAMFMLTAIPGPIFAAEDEKGFVPMFNGKDLDGWEGKAGGWWVEEGALTSESTPEKPCVKHHYLYWKGGEPADFVLRFQYRLVGGNSGVQFRSQTRPDWDTWGYQADMEAGTQWTGCLFQHDRGGVVMRGKKAVIAEDGTRTEQEFATGEELQKKIKADDWNDYEIVAEGSKIVLKINGHLMCEVDDRDTKLACKKGIIALQMHPGPPMKVQFRNMRILVSGPRR